MAKSKIDELGEAVLDALTSHLTVSDDLPTIGSIKLAYEIIRDNGWKIDATDHQKEEIQKSLKGKRKLKSVSKDEQDYALGE